MLVTASLDRSGILSLRPVSDTLALRFAAIVAHNGGPPDATTAHVKDTADTLADFTDTQRADLRAGLPIRFHASAWYVGDHYGFHAGDDYEAKHGLH